MASRDLTSAFNERRSATNLRRRSAGSNHATLVGATTIPPFAISKKKHDFADDHLLMEVKKLPVEASTIYTAFCLLKLTYCALYCFCRQDGAIYASTLPPDWVNDVDAVNSTVTDIQRLMSELASMHASRIGTVFGRDLDHMEKQIDRKTTEVTSE